MLRNVYNWSMILRPLRKPACASERIFSVFNSLLQNWCKDFLTMTQQTDFSVVVTVCVVFLLEDRHNHSYPPVLRYFFLVPHLYEKFEVDGDANFFCCHDFLGRDVVYHRRFAHLHSLDGEFHFTFKKRCSVVDMALVRGVEFVEDGAVNGTRRVLELFEMLLPPILDQHGFSEHDSVFVLHCSYAWNIVTGNMPDHLVC